VGVAIITLPMLQGRQWSALLSPVFGPAADQGQRRAALGEEGRQEVEGLADYEAYKKNAPVLVRS
jgi:hypothetical protein